MGGGGDIWYYQRSRNTIVKYLKYVLYFEILTPFLIILHYFQASSQSDKTYILNTSALEKSSNENKSYDN